MVLSVCLSAVFADVMRITLWALYICREYGTLFLRECYIRHPRTERIEGRCPKRF
jgi:hypothetical protein